ncbi:hypothetical protein C8035_v004018 [Colletotrichum spinosum]|uniref:RING-type domain-containing protein n=1 Tax=Colletotrichum spinosum TaxID=1347390 RepID=A0A4R8Q7F4_9PEZI|nr:hypothetical protein C8035_v004018 [Colletotrichum spinosum]
MPRHISNRRTARAEAPPVPEWPAPRRSPRRSAASKPEYRVNTLFNFRRYTRAARKQADVASPAPFNDIGAAGQNEGDLEAGVIDAAPPADVAAAAPDAGAPAEPKKLDSVNCTCGTPESEKLYIFSSCGHTACQACLDQRGTCCGRLQNVQVYYQAGVTDCPVCWENPRGEWCILVCVLFQDYRRRQTRPKLPLL